MRDAVIGGRLSRGGFLKLAGGLVLLGALTVAQTAGGTPVSALSLGISPRNTGAENRKNLVAALKGSAGSFVFPAGDYLIDNSGQAIVIENFAGALAMEPGARFVFTENTRGGFNFHYGSGARFVDLTVSYLAAPPQRVPAQEALHWTQTSETHLEGVSVEGSAGAGVLLGECVRPVVEGVLIRNTRADGLHIANCHDARVNDVLAENTGDDGVAFLNYGGGTDLAGGLATNITIRNSRTRGIAVIGQRDVIIDGFEVDGTVGPGLICARDENYNTRTPSNVRFLDGTVRNAGKVEGASGSKCAILYSNVRSVAFEDIEVLSPVARGVSGVSPEGEVRLKRIRVHGSGESGFTLSARALALDALLAEDTGGTGVGVVGSGSVSYGTLTSKNCSKTSSLRRAFNFENNARIDGVELYVADEQPRPTGYKINASSTQSGRLGRVYDRVLSRDVQISNPSGLAVNLQPSRTLSSR